LPKYSTIGSKTGDKNSPGVNANGNNPGSGANEKKTGLGANGINPEDNVGTNKVGQNGATVASEYDEENQQIAGSTVAGKSGIFPKRPSDQNWLQKNPLNNKYTSSFTF